MVALFVFVAIAAIAALVLGYAWGHDNGYAEGMKENGWRRTIDGWYKETL